MTEPFEDPIAVDRDGVPVSLAPDRWRTKIGASHPEMLDRLADVVRAIELPDVVLQDREFARRRHHLWRDDSGAFVTVVVQYTYTEHGIVGTVVTAFIRRRLRSGDVILFARGTP